LPTPQIARQSRWLIDSSFIKRVCRH
jgi:hypothetical protein